MFSSDHYADTLDFSWTRIGIQSLFGISESIDKIYSLDPSSFIVGDKQHSKLRFCYGNGINTDLELARSDASYLSRLTGDYEIHGLHNPTHGIALDLNRCCLELLGGIESKNIRCRTDFIRNQIESLPENGALVSVVHSEGAIIERAVLQNLSEEYRSRIHVIGVCPGVLIEENLARSVVNIRNSKMSRDCVPWIGGMLRSNNHFYNVVEVPSHHNTPAFDHSFQSGSYCDQIKIQLKEVQKKYR